jgi:hypothetical protein
VPLRYWDNAGNRRQYFDWLAEQLGLSSPKDWENVRTSDVVEWEGGGIMDRYSGSLVRALSEIYPGSNFRNFPVCSSVHVDSFVEHQWTTLHSVSTAQRKTISVLASVLDVPLIQNFRHPDFAFSGSGSFCSKGCVTLRSLLESRKTMELDIYVPSQQLAFEYQGISLPSVI